jgi:hypothetical protein
MTWSEQPLQSMAYNPQRHTVAKRAISLNSPRRIKGKGFIEIKRQNNRNNQTQGEEALRGGTRRDRARVFDCPDSEQYCIEIEVWSSLYK